MIEKDIYPCPRCPDVNLTKKFALRKKLRHWSCKKCKGVMLNVDDINKLPFIGSRIIKKHNIEKFLGSGDIGTLRCGTCTSKMNEIHIVCKKNDKHYHPVETATAITAGAILGIGALFVSLIFPPASLTGHMLAKRQHKKIKEMKLRSKEIEIITIDGCSRCSSFWFDGGELRRLYRAKILKKYSGMNNKDLNKFKMDAEKNYSDIAGFTSKDDKIEWENISSPKKGKAVTKPLPEGKIVGKFIGKDTPSEGMMILNRKTNKWDFIREGKIIGKDTPSEGVMTLNKKTKKWDFVPKSKDN
jgi:Zn-finger nucleic acid-binding protein